MNNIVIRSATSDDASAVADIARECWNNIYDGYRRQLGDDVYDTVYPFDPIVVKGDKVFAVVEDGRAFVAEINGVICGFATYSVEGAIGVLKDNAVRIGFQGLGIAGKLYDAVFEKLRQSGCSIVRVGTGLDDAHAPARRAYEKVGFEKSLSSITYYKKL